MENRKLTREDIDKVRSIDGFPDATDEDIIALSDAPYYTACPNPFIEDFIRENGTAYDEATDDYHCEPFAADVSEGKNDPIYNAHSYHTKVPYKAIMRYILHYTKPGDIVFDGFCGTGMTGVAAQMCGSEDNSLRYNMQQEMPGIQWGARKAILSDLSPAATFIAYNYNTPVDVEKFRAEAQRILSECEKECGWMYQTNHRVNGNPVYDITGDEIKGRINYTVWSDVFICPHCGEEIVFWNAAVDKKSGSVKDTFLCPKCGMSLTKRDCDRAKDIHFDDLLGETVTMAKQVPVLINYTAAGKRYEKQPDEDDLALIRKIDAMPITDWVPTDELPKGEKTADPKRLGITHVHQFYTRRNLAVLGRMWGKCSKSVISKQMEFCLTSVIIKTASKLHNIGLKNGKFNLAGAMPNALYIPSTVAERNLITLIEGKLNDIFPVFSFEKSLSNIRINCASSSKLVNISSETVDYIFVDPPFGANLNYSELSFIWEAWLKAKTKNKTEAIISKTQGKGLFEYQFLMTSCFAEFYRILKPNHWMTVEFHNSKNSVWNAIQTALSRAGFIIADVHTLDKGQGSYNQMTSNTAVKQDLVISCYKPKDSLLRQFRENAGTEETAWAFVRQHLENLPVTVDADKNGKLDMVEERLPYLLFDRMVAYHIMQGLPVPVDAPDFYKGLDEHFLRRDGMYFLPSQVNEYDEKRAVCDIENVQIANIVTDEKTAISWLYSQLDENAAGPQTYQDLSPKFMQELRGLDKREKLPELITLLEENFLKDEEGKWYIPDLTKSGDIAKLREKNLLKEFAQYQQTKGKLKVFRSEAVRAGFAKLWKEKDYKAIVEMAERLPEETIQEDSSLLMYYDISLGRV